MESNLAIFNVVDTQIQVLGKLSDWFERVCPRLPSQFSFGDVYNSYPIFIECVESILASPIENGGISLSDFVSQIGNEIVEVKRDIIFIDGKWLISFAPHFRPQEQYQRITDVQKLALEKDSEREFFKEKYLEVISLMYDLEASTNGIANFIDTIEYTDLSFQQKSMFKNSRRQIEKTQRILKEIISFNGQ